MIEKGRTDVISSLLYPSWLFFFFFCRSLLTSYVKWSAYTGNSWLASPAENCVVWLSAIRCQVLDANTTKDLLDQTVQILLYVTTFLFIHLILTFVLKTHLLYTLLIFSNLVFLFFFFFKIFWMKTFRKLVKLLSHVWLFATPCTVAYQVPPSMGFSRQEYWSGLPFPSPGDLSDPGIKPGSPAL